MRILRTEGSDEPDWIPRLCTHNGQPYAILSHCWLTTSYHEVLFTDIEEIDRTIDVTVPDAQPDVLKNVQYAGVPPHNKPGFKKLQGAARQALEHGYEYIWIDTCCIDKSSSAELSEAINSMWKYYKASNVCYVYLEDVPAASDEAFRTLFAEARWWTRGWTLQELLAPSELTFFSKAWEVIGHKKYMDVIISHVTGIEPNVINGTISMESISIAQRMSWASKRVTTRTEDTAYSLMGIFGVNMPLLYGEGESAFVRLQYEIMKDSDDETIFAWKDNSIGPDVYSGLLASRPSAFTSSRKTVRYQDEHGRAPYTVTNKGLSITVPLVETPGGLFRAVLNCADPEMLSTNVNIYLKKVSETSAQYARVRCQEWASPVINEKAKVMTIYVKQSYDQKPAYEVLGETDKIIRLFRIVPAEDNSDLRVKLMEANPETSRYTALSYVWGSTGLLHTIWVNSEPVKVTQNVFDFLRKARRELRDGLFWIDAICVQMSDLEERYSQTRVMRQIYDHAAEVSIWLGDVDASHAALQSLFRPRRQAIWSYESSVEALEARQEGSYKGAATALSSLIKIASHPYWTRAWVVQELYLAHEITIELNTFSITGDELTRMYEAASAIGNGNYLKFVDALAPMGRLLKFVESAGLPYATSITNEDFRFPGQRTTKPQLEFEPLLRKFQFQVCSDIRDRVYSIIGISDLATKLRINYSGTNLTVFFDVLDCLGACLTLTILPLLVRVLRIKEHEALEMFDVPQADKVEYRIVQAAEDIMEDVKEDKSSTEFLSDEEFANFTWDTDFVCLLEEDDAESVAGLVFTKRNSRYADRLSTQQAICKPSKLCIRETSGRCSFKAIPSPLRDWLTHTYGVLDDSAFVSQQMRIVTDRKGALAIGLCSQSINPIPAQGPEPPTESIESKLAAQLPRRSRLKDKLSIVLQFRS